MKNSNSTLIFALALLPASWASADFLTSQDPFITLDDDVPAGSSVLAIINSGESLGGFTFQGLPRRYRAGTWF